MFRNLFSSVLIVTSAFVLAFGQTPESKKENQEKPQAFSFTWDDGGAYLGVQTQEVTKENFAKLGLREVRGVAVEKVIENSPAAAAGLQAGDVIVKFNGDEVTSARKLTRLIGEVDPDHLAKLTVLRNGREQELTATLAKRPGPSFGEGNYQFNMPTDKWVMPDLKNIPQMKDFDFKFKDMPDLNNIPQMKDFDFKFKDMPDLNNIPQMKDFDFKFKEMPDLKNLPQMKEFEFKNMPDGDHFFKLPNGDGEVFKWFGGNARQIGASVTPLTKQLADHFGVAGGSLINEVRENSPAAKAGLKAGDIIVEVNGKPIKGDMDLTRTINEKKDGDVQLTIVRNGNRQTVTVTPEPAKDGGFFFQTDQDSFTSAPPTPGQMRIAPTRPATQVTPAPMTLFHPARVV